MNVEGWLWVIASFTLASSQLLNIREDDLIMQPGAKGPDVVDDVVCLISLLESEGVFDEDHAFLRRLGRVETGDGSISTSMDNRGGIWQVDESKFDMTQNNVQLEAKYRAIAGRFDFNWEDVTWPDLQKPLISALAARLFLCTITRAIPTRIDGQAAFWKRYFNLEGDISDFIRLAISLSTLVDQCRSVADIAFVIDSSGSIEPASFNQAKEFVIDVIERFNLGPDAARFAIIQYSTEPVIEFNFNDFDGLIEGNLWREKINNIRQIRRNTNTGKAIDFMREQLFGEIGGSRPLDMGIPRIAIVMTDGQSQDDVEVPSENAREDRIAMCAIGISDKINVAELNQIANGWMHVFLVDAFDVIDEVIRAIVIKACDEPAVINGSGSGGDINDNGAIRNFVAQVPADGESVTVTLTIPQGEAVVYFSGHRCISYALYGGKLETFPDQRTVQLVINNRTPTKKRQVGQTIPLYIRVVNKAAGPTRFQFAIEEGDTRIPGLEPPLNVPACDLSRPCENGGQCASNGVCQCVQCFYGERCELVVQDPCSVGCSGNGVCIRQSNSCYGYTCQCYSGYAGSNCDKIEPNEPPLQISECPHSIEGFSNSPFVYAPISWKPPTVVSTLPGATIDVRSRRFNNASLVFVRPGWAALIEYEIWDDQGNTATCAFSIAASVADTNIQLVDCPQSTIVDTADFGSVIKKVSWIQPTAFVEISGTTHPISHSSASVYPDSTGYFYVGNSLVYYLFGQRNSNPRVCSFVVEVHPGRLFQGVGGRKKRDQFPRRLFQGVGRRKKRDQFPNLDICANNKCNGTTCVPCIGEELGYACVSDDSDLEEITCIIDNVQIEKDNGGYTSDESPNHKLQGGTATAQQRGNYPAIFSPMSASVSILILLVVLAIIIYVVLRIKNSLKHPIAGHHVDNKVLMEY